MDDNRGVLSRLDGLQQYAGIAGAVGLAACLVGAFVARPALFQGYLVAWVFWACVTLGCFGLLLLHNALRNRWTLPILRFLEAGGGPTMFVVLAILFVPVLLGMGDIYHWLHAYDEPYQVKRPYLNLPFFLARTVFYFVVWFLLARLLVASSRRQDASGNLAEQQYRTNWAAPGLLIYVLTVTFAFTDWVMSIDYHWFSTVYGVWFAIAQGLSALAFIALLVCWLARVPPVSTLATPSFLRDLGNLMLAFVMLWAYISFTQYLIIFSGNLPEFITYYRARTTGAWWYLSVLISIGQFFVPFLFLLSTRTKRTPALLGGVAAWILFMRFVDYFWNISPFFNPGPHAFTVPLWDVVALVGIGGVWLAIFVWQLKSHPLLPAHGVTLEEAGHHA